jgi:precorrin-2 dehydrogenase / sirohydrochlorin ferrochelatase
MALYPVSLCLRNKLCIVIGSGEVASRKIMSLLHAGATVRVIAPEGKKIEGVAHTRRAYRKGDLEGAFLVIAATDSKEVNEAVYRDALSQNILINVVDNPPLCTFFVPSVINRGDMQISISTGGKCPALAKKIRREIEGLYGQEYEAYLTILEEGRRNIMQSFTADERKDKIQDLVDDTVLLELVKANRLAEAREKIRQNALLPGSRQSP